MPSSVFCGYGSVLLWLTVDKAHGSSILEEQTDNKQVKQYKMLGYYVKTIRVRKKMFGISSYRLSWQEGLFDG